jgi:glycolate oxidase iron-sulfur subunit
MATSLKSLDYSVLQQCMHCGMCLPSCPTYDATLRERSSPRGRISLMRAIADGELQVSPAFADEMSFCLGCLACQSACPAGVDYATLFETSRAAIEATPLPHRHWTRAGWRWFTLEFLFFHPRWLRFAGILLRFYQTSGLEKGVRKFGLTRLLPKRLRDLEPQAPRIAEYFSHQLIDEVEAPFTPPAAYHVAMLTGCVQDLVFSAINRDTVEVLVANGCRVHTPAVQPCCGSLHSHNGEPSLAAELARRMIDLFPPADYDAIITNAGGCGSHLRHYSALLADDLAYSARAREWDSKVRDIHEWLIEIGCRAPRVAAAAGPIKVTYHESCHLVHGQKIKFQPRELLSKIPGVTLVELPESSWCCGSAGIYNITQPAMSAELLERKMNHIRATGADVVATSNPGCHLQIARGLAAAENGPELVQPVTLLARAYRRESAAALVNVPPA